MWLAIYILDNYSINATSFFYSIFTKPYGIINVAAYGFHTCIANHSEVYLSAT